MSPRTCNQFTSSRFMHTGSFLRANAAYLRLPEFCFFQLQADHFLRRTNGPVAKMVSYRRTITQLDAILFWLQ